MPAPSGRLLACILMSGIQRIGNVFYRVPDMDAAVHFYRDVLGLALKFRDGDHWAAFDVGGSTLAVEGSAAGGPGGATVSLRVDGLDALVSELRSRGASVSDVTTGPHERRAAVHDPAGNELVLYEPA
jgi:catechol 2,3-dioxygenase-like lactoylglutathione lyase family enzyme